MIEKYFKLFNASCFLILLILSGCSSLHVDILPTVDWTHVKVVEFQSPLQDHWKLTQPIRSELQGMGFQVEDMPAHPDLLFSYFTQSSIDLTVESEKVMRLRSLHIQFTDPKTKTLVAAADYFYPDNTHPSEFALGVKELFAGIREQTANPSRVNKSATPAKVVEHQTQVPTTATTNSSQPKVAIKKQSTPENSTETSAVETITSHTPAPTSAESEISHQEKITPVLDKSSEKMQQAVQKTRSPWIPKFQSWGFENWGQDSTDDY
ncbi:DUF4136 domain-containing protein [uncultured Desulfuromusa sp.]|uniref:DUF4136 domain-containing protein n=1 Tax=uncultured Desulfuromusa sp. TaxID=219183 RepID=UPI002AA8F94C|nr:DUF4136 domain-containing protein [uncultured Desulfuromusa sp.]